MPHEDANVSSLKPLDRFLQRWRIRMAGKFIPPGARVLDVGSHDGALFRTLPHLTGGVGIDPEADPALPPPNAVLLRGYFPQALPQGTPPFDAITMLAVLEHIPLEMQPVLAHDCWTHLRPGGRVVLTVPSPLVDRILAVLQALKLVKGMSVEQHYGYDVSQTEGLFEAAGFRTLAKRRFQLGLNNLFVFERAAGQQA